MIQYSEKDIEDMIIKADPADVRAAGLECFDHHKTLQQFNLGGYGIADMIGVRHYHLDDKPVVGAFTIYEIKKDEIGLSALAQACRYAAGIEAYLKSNRYIQARDFCKIVLIGSKIEFGSNFVYAGAFMSAFVEFYTYTFDFHGLKFTKCEMGDYYPSRRDISGFGVLNNKTLNEAFEHPDIKTHPTLFLN